MGCIQTQYGCAQDLQPNDGKVSKAEIKRAEDILTNAVDRRYAQSDKYWRDVAVSCRAIELSVSNGGQPHRGIPAAFIGRAEQDVAEKGSAEKYANAAARSIANVEERRPTNEEPVAHWSQSISRGVGQVVQHEKQVQRSYGQYAPLDVPQGRGAQGGGYYDNRQQYAPQYEQYQGGQYQGGQSYYSPQYRPQQPSNNNRSSTGTIPFLPELNRATKDINSLRGLINKW